MTEIAALGLRVDGAEGVERSASALDHLTKSADSAEKAADRLSKESWKSKKALDDVAKSGEDASGSVSSLAAAASRAGAIIGAAFSVTAIARYADAWSDMTSLVRVNIGAQEDAADVMSRLSDIARMTYSSMEATARSFATNAFTLNALGKSTQQQLDYTEALNNALVVSGAKGQQFEMVQNSLNRAMAEGSLRGTELQNVLNYGSRVAGLLAEELGVSVTELRALAAQGKITGEVIYNALTKNMEAVREEAESMPATIGDAFTLMRNAVLQTVGVFDQQNALSETLATTLISVADNMRSVVAILAGATAGWITYQLAVNGVSVALGIATAAQRVFNAAAMANPYVAAATAIVAVGTALYGLRNQTIGTGEDTARVGDYMRATWDAVKDSVSGLTTFISTAWSSVSSELSRAAGDMSISWSSAWTEMQLFAHGHVNNLIGLIAGIAESSAIVGRAIVDAFRNAFSTALKLAEAFGKDLKRILSGDLSFNNFRTVLQNEIANPTIKVSKDIRDAFKKNLGKDWLGDAVSGIKDFASGISETAKASYRLNKDLDDLIANSGLFSGAVATAAGNVGDLNAGLKGTSDELQKILDKLYPLKAQTRSLEADLNTLRRATAEGLVDPSVLDDWYEKNLMIADSIREEMVPAVEEMSAQADPLTESWQEALNRIDNAFVDLWKSAFNGFKDFADSLKNAFIQLLAELAHRATTQKILISFGFGGVSSGAMAGGGGASGLGNILSLRNLTSGLQSGLASVGAAAMTGINWIGETGAQALYRLGYQQAASSWSLGASAFANSLVSAGQTVGGWLGMSGLSANAAAGLGGLATAGAGWVGARVGGDLGLALTGKEGSGWGSAGGAAIGAYVGSIIPGIGTIIGSALGGLIGGVVDSIFGSSAWNTTRGGIELGFGESGFDPMMWERQTKKGGLFGSTKRRYKYQDLDPELAGAMDEAYTSTLDSVRELYSLLGVSIEDGFLESVRVASLQIGATGKSKQAEEEIQKQIAEWFSSLQEAAVKAVDASLNFETLAVYASSLSAVNEVFNAIGLSAFDLSVESGKAASSLLQLAGGIENLLVATDFYYQNFYSEQERLSRLTDETAAAFEALGLTLPDSRSGFRSLVESIDRTTEAGQMMFLQLLNLAPSMHTIASAAEAAEAELAALSEAAERELAALSEAVEREFSSAMNAIFGSIRSMDDAYKPAALMIDAYRESASALQNLISTYDGSLDATVHLSEAMGVHQRLAYNLVEAYLSANTAVEALFGGLKESIRTSLMSAEELYEYQRGQVHSLTDLLGTLTDPEAIMRTSQEIERLVSGMWGRLDEGQRSELGDEFLDYLDRTEALAQDRLSQGLAELESTQSDIYSALTSQMNDVADRMIETADRMQAAADLQWQSSMQFGAYVQQMGAILLNMGHGQEQNA